MGYYGFQWRPYVSVAERRRQAEKELAALRKKGHTPRPVRIEGRTIASSAWGSAWCDHLESFSDYENRLPRGRTYARNGSVIDLQIAAGKVTALVMGSELYRIAVTIHTLPRARWTSLVADTSGRIDSVLGLLRGRIDGAVMARMCDRQRGLFPSPREIDMKCSCPDYAGLCKHIAATLYGVGARLDSEPELLFLLRGVDHAELISAGARALTESAADQSAATADEAALGALFGIDLGEAGEGDKPVPVAPSAPARPAVAAKPAAKSAAGKPAPGKAAQPDSPKIASPSLRKAPPPAKANPAPTRSVRTRRHHEVRLSVRHSIAAKTSRKPARPKSEPTSIAAIIAAAVKKTARKP